MLANHVCHQSWRMMNGLSMEMMRKRTKRFSPNSKSGAQEERAQAAFRAVRLIRRLLPVTDAAIDGVTANVPVAVKRVVGRVAVAYFHVN